MTLEVGLEEAKELQPALGVNGEEMPKAPPPFSSRDSSGSVAAYLGANRGDPSTQRRIEYLENYIRRRGIV